MNQLAAFARQFKDVHEFLSQLALISNVDAEAAPDQTATKKRSISPSVHQAKGLEFHTVFVIWLTDGMFPSTRSLETRDAMEEERRLFYVAITRARDELYLTYPHMRLNAGYGDVFQRPSRFLKEIPNDLVEDWQVQRQMNRMSNAERMTQRKSDESTRNDETNSRDRLSFASSIRISALISSIRHSSFVILFMNLSPDKKIAGVLVPLFALRRRGRSGNRRSRCVAGVY